MIFLMATFWLVSWSRAELKRAVLATQAREALEGRRSEMRTTRGQKRPCQRAAGRSICAGRQRAPGLAAVNKRRTVPRPRAKRRAKTQKAQKGEQAGYQKKGQWRARAYREVISNVVPKIWVRMNSAMVSSPAVAAGLLCDAASVARSWESRGRSADSAACRCCLNSMLGGGSRCGCVEGRACR